MFLAQIRFAAVEVTESRAGILRLIGGDSLKPTGAWTEDKVEKQIDVVQAAAPTEIDDSLEDDKTDTTVATKDSFARYRKMLKVGVPRGTVEEQMRIDGVIPTALDVKGMFGTEQVTAPVVRDSRVTKKTKRRRWHWTEVAEVDRTAPPSKGSLWTQVNEKGAHQRLSACSQAYIQELYVKEITNLIESSERVQLQTSATTAPTIHRARSAKPDKVQILKGNKAVNLEFAVKRVTRSFEKVARDVNILTAMYLQDTDIKTILAMWPSMAEEIALEEYSEDFDALKRSEQFLVMIRSVPMAKEKLKCLLLKLELPSRAENLKQAAGLVTRALNQLCSSSKFTRVMHLLRDFGNLANEEFVTNYRARFSLRSLVTMTNTKSFDNTNTMLDGFLHVLEMEDDGNLSTFYDEIHLVLQCKSVSVDSLLSEMNQLREGHLLVKSVARASNDAAGDDAILAHKAFTQFADEVDDKLRGVQTSLDAMKTSKHTFEAWFEEDSRAPLDGHLKAIVHFALEVKARHALRAQK